MTEERTRRRFLKDVIGLAAGGGFLAGAASPTWAQSGSPKRGGTLNVVLDGPINTFDTAKILFYQEREAARLVYDPLIALGDNGQPLAQRSLAERWEFTDPRTFVLHLRQGVKFQDGTPFDADAAKFNLDRHLDPAIASSAASELTPVAGVDVVNASTLKINLKNPTVAFPVTLFDRAGYQISPTAWRRYGKDDYGAHPAGTGPFKLTEFKPGVSSTLVRNPDYWDKPMPYLDQIVFTNVPADTTRLIQLQSNMVQIAAALPYQDIARIKNMPSVVLYSQLLRMELLRWNVDSEYGKSVELRKAFDWVLDREAIKRVVYYDTGQVGYGPYFPGTPFYDAGYKPYTRDIGKAKELLDKSGLPSPIKFTYYVAQDPVRQREAQIYQANLHDIGVTIDIQIEENAAFNARQNNGNYNLTATWWGWRPDPYFYMPIFASNGANFTYFQPGQWKDPKFDQLINQAAGEADLNRRVAEYRQAAQLLNEGAGWSFYRFGPQLVGTTAKLRGYTYPISTIVDYAKVWLD